MTRAEADAALAHIQNVLAQVCEGYGIDGFAIVVVLPAGTPDADVGVTLGARGPDPLRVLFYSACGALARKLVAVASGEPPGRRVPAGRWS